MKRTRFFYVMILAFGCAGWILLLEKMILYEPETKKISISTAVPKEPEEDEKNNELYKEPVIRVLLMNDGYSSYYHKSIEIQDYQENMVFTDSEIEKDRIRRISASKGELTVLSMNRNSGHPSYRGILEIRKEQDGFLLINELPLEEYLKGVVPSEMPADFEKEALKAQTICARTYALRQMQEKRLKEYDADVDDSVGFQVFQQIPPQKNTSEAVDETRGMVLLSDGELIEAYYFSTSSGITGTEDVWGIEDGAEYLKSVPCSFDEEAPWRAWETELSFEKIEKSLEKNYEACGSLKNLYITKKSMNGTVTGLTLVTDKENLTIEGEYNIREILSPQGVSISRKNGTACEGGSLLPSACFTLDAEPENRTLHIYGAGYGHGVGMSQNAAQKMALEGYDCQEILNYFFQKIEIASYTAKSISE